MCIRDSGWIADLIGEMAQESFGLGPEGTAALQDFEALPSPSGAERRFGDQGLVDGSGFGFPASALETASEMQKSAGAKLGIPLTLERGPFRRFPPR